MSNPILVVKVCFAENVSFEEISNCIDNYSIHNGLLSIPENTTIPDTYISPMSSYRRNNTVNMYMRSIEKESKKN